MLGSGEELGPNIYDKTEEFIICCRADTKAGCYSSRRRKAKQKGLLPVIHRQQALLSLKQFFDLTSEGHFIFTSTQCYSHFAWISSIIKESCNLLIIHVFVIIPFCLCINVLDFFPSAGLHGRNNRLISNIIGVLRDCTVEPPIAYGIF